MFTPPQNVCPFDGAPLWIGQHRPRTIHGLDQTIEATFRDAKCSNPDCNMPRLRYRPVEESLIALPNSSFGLDVLLSIGSMRLRNDFSFPRIHKRLREQGVPISPMAVQYQFRNYLALIACHVGLEDGKLRDRLRRQGAIIPVIDGVQFGEGDPVLYLIIDALSRQPLFGKELFCRGKDELVPFIAQLNDLDIPIPAVVSDKETALVSAIEEALPDVPHQFCQLHYLGNVAKPMEADLQALNAEVKKTEEKLRGFQRELTREAARAEEEGKTPAKDLDVSLKLCEAARNEARKRGKAPFDPPALKRHDGLEKVAEAVNDAQKKKGNLGQI